MIIKAVLLANLEVTRERIFFGIKIARNYNIVCFKCESVVFVGIIGWEGDEGFMYFIGYFIQGAITSGLLLQTECF